jgi:hypothetical protein
MTTLSPISDAAWQEAAEKTENWPHLIYERQVWEAAFYQAWHDIDAVSMRNKVLMQEALHAQHTAILECFWRRFHEAKAAQITPKPTPKPTQTPEAKKPWNTFTFWFVVPWSIIFIISCFLFGSESGSESGLTAGDVFLFAAFCATAGTLTLWFVASIAWAGGFLSETVVKAGMKATGYDESSSDTKGS